MSRLLHLVVICFFFFGIIVNVEAQTRIDSLEGLLKNEISEVERINLKLQLAELYLERNFDRTEEILDGIDKSISEINSTNLEIEFLLIKSNLYRQTFRVDEAKNLTLKALGLAEKVEDSMRQKALIYFTLGVVYDDASEIKGSIEYHLLALRYAESINDERTIARICAGLGRAYLFLDEYENAKQYYKRAIEIKEQLNEFDKNLGSYYTNLSSCFDNEGKYDESLFYLDKAIELKKSDEGNLGLIPAYNNKAYTLYLMKRLSEAEKVALKAISLADSLEWQSEQMYVYSTYAEILFAQGREQKAEDFMERSIEIAKKFNDLYLIKYNYELMYNIHLENGDYRQALDYYKQRSSVVDTIYNIQKRSEIEKLALDYNTEKKNQAIAQLNKEKELNQIALRRSNQLQITYLVGALLALLVVFLLYSRQKIKKKTDALIKASMEREFEKKLADSELQALRAQMNPHFLFNCLNSINSFIIKNDQEKASEYLSKFSKLIRRVLSNSKENKVTLANELEALELYIEMEALRFGNKFNYEIIVDPNVETDYLEVPPMIIQPFVENSIWHGLMHKTNGDGKLSVHVSSDNGMLTYCIQDNGIGREAAAALKSKSAEKRKSYGMSITKERLQYNSVLDDSNTEINIEDLKNEEGNGIGTRVTIKIAA